MAENPARWGTPVKIINEVLDEDHRRNLSGEFWCGNTLPMQIARALANAGYLDVDDLWNDEPLPATPEPKPFATAAERYFNDQLNDPEYRDTYLSAREALRS